jgi:glycine/D-amino acid oxidase-like deaminating enzyme
MSSAHSISRSRSRGADRVLVVGAGVSGLTTALSLARAGVEVEVVAERFECDLVSVVAGALWEWPPAVCGHHRDETSVHRSKTWATIVHNYGHGGSGFSFSWGCAREVTETVVHAATAMPLAA